MIASALLGGTASKMSGGKFANGAATAAFASIVSEGVASANDGGTQDVLADNDPYNDWLADAPPDGYYDQYRSAELWMPGDLLPQGLVDFSAGFGDALSFGGTAAFRELLGDNVYVNFGSTEYAGGVVSGVAVHAVGFRRGAELNIGKNVRLAPWGNRTGNKYGKYPHYHRRGIDSSTGKVKPGQGIGRHRPQETKSTDTKFWDRF